jgi:hypothetical protein
MRAPKALLALSFTLLVSGCGPKDVGCLFTVEYGHKLSNLEASDCSMVDSKADCEDLSGTDIDECSNLIDDYIECETVDAWVDPVDIDESDLETACAAADDVLSGD